MLVLMMELMLKLMMKLMMMIMLMMVMLVMLGLPHILHSSPLRMFPLYTTFSGGETFIEIG